MVRIITLSLVTLHLSMPHKFQWIKNLSTGVTGKLDLTGFQAALTSSKLVADQTWAQNTSVNDLFLHTVMFSVPYLDQFVPYVLVKTKRRCYAPWFDADCHIAKRVVCRAERRWHHTRSDSDKQALDNEWHNLHCLYRGKEAKLWDDKLNKAGNSSQAKWKVASHLLARGSSFSCSSSSYLSADDLHDFFSAKVDTICINKAVAGVPIYRPYVAPCISDFKHVSADTITKMINGFASNHCYLDPIPTWLLEDSIHLLAPFICIMVNTFLSYGYLLDSKKIALVEPHLKKTGLDLNSASSYCLISNLSFIFKLIEGVVYTQLTSHLDNTDLLPSNQSAYWKG